MYMYMYMYMVCECMVNMYKTLKYTSDRFSPQFIFQTTQYSTLLGFPAIICLSIIEKFLLNIFRQGSGGLLWLLVMLLLYL